jgi:hypothetical protein
MYYQLAMKRQNPQDWEDDWEEIEGQYFSYRDAADAASIEGADAILEMKDRNRCCRVIEL